MLLALPVVATPGAGFTSPGSSIVAKVVEAFASLGAWLCPKSPLCPRRKRGRRMVKIVAVSPHRRWTRWDRQLIRTVSYSFQTSGRASCAARRFSPHPNPSSTGRGARIATIALRPTRQPTPRRPHRQRLRRAREARRRFGLESGDRRTPRPTRSRVPWLVLPRRRQTCSTRGRPRVGRRLRRQTSRAHCTTCRILSRRALRSPRRNDSQFPAASRLALAA